MQMQFVGRVDTAGASWQVFLRPAPRTASSTGLAFQFLEQSPEQRSMVRPVTVAIVQELLGASGPPQAVLRRELERALSAQRGDATMGGR